MVKGRKIGKDEERKRGRKSEVQYITTEFCPLYAEKPDVRGLRAKSCQLPSDGNDK
jgi:hypothetical protein